MCALCIRQKFVLKAETQRLWESIRFGVSKTNVIFQWSLVSATVGLLFALLEKFAQRLGGVGEALVDAVRGILGFVWPIVTLFVVPTLVYEDVSPQEAIKRSTDIIKKTWGENIISHYGLGFIQLLVIILWIGNITGLALTLSSGTGTLFAIGLGVFGLLFITLIFNVAKTVFQTALYVYASSGNEPDLFGSLSLASAFQPKKNA